MTRVEGVIPTMVVSEIAGGDGRVGWKSWDPELFPSVTHAKRAGPPSHLPTVSKRLLHYPALITLKNGKLS